MRLRNLLLPAILFGALSFSACSSDEQGNVLVMHASPSAPNVDVLVDGSAVLTDVGFKASSGYLNVDAGDRTFALNATGTTTEAINATQTITAEMNYSIFAYDDASNTLRLLVTNDDLSAPAAGNAHVRVVHASADGPAVDVVAITGTDTTTTGFTNLTVGNASAFAPLAAGSYTLGVAPTGTTTAVYTETFNLQDGKIYTIVATGLLAPSDTTKAFDLVVIENN